MLFLAYLVFLLMNGRLYMGSLISLFTDLLSSVANAPFFLYFGGIFALLAIFGFIDRGLR